MLLTHRLFNKCLHCTGQNYFFWVHYFSMIQKIPPAVWIHGYKSSKYPEIWFVSHFQRKNRNEILLINYSWAHYDVNTSWEIPTACGNVSKNQPLQIYEWNKLFSLCVISCLRFQIRHNSLFMICLQLDGASYFLRPVFAYLRTVIAIENQQVSACPGKSHVRFKMPKKSELTSFQKGQIFALSEEGYFNREIATRLGIDESTVTYNLKKMKETGSMVNKERSG